MLLDTSFLIDLMRGNPDAVKKAEELERDMVQQRLSSITIFELYYGVARSVNSTREKERIREVIGSKPTHPANVTIMQQAGRMSGELANEGTPIDDADVIVGTTASVLDEPVLTRNVDHFERLVHISIETY